MSYRFHSKLDQKWIFPFKMSKWFQAKSRREEKNTIEGVTVSLILNIWARIKRDEGQIVGAGYLCEV